MSITVAIDVNKEDVENLAQGLDCCAEPGMRRFFEKVLKKTQEAANAMIETANELSGSNPFSLSVGK